jgi:hypothetical protein
MNFNDCPVLDTVSIWLFNLETLNIIDCPALRKLYANGLQQFNISGHNDLMELNVSGNFEEANLSACPGLKTLYISSIFLTELDLSTCQNLYELYCAACRNLKFLYLAKGQTIPKLEIPYSTQIIIKE